MIKPPSAVNAPHCIASTLADAAVSDKELSVPVVLRFSLPNEIAPLESVMDPFASVRVPTAEPVAAVSTPHPSVPVVLRFSLPNEIAPLESVMDPSASVRLPTLEPVAAVNTPQLTVPLPASSEPTVTSPVVIKLVTEGNCAARVGDRAVCEREVAYGSTGSRGKHTTVECAGRAKVLVAKCNGST